MTFGLFSLTVTIAGLATGGCATNVTFNVTAAAFEVKEPSFAVKLKLSLPE